MSGPVAAADTVDVPVPARPAASPQVEVVPGREAMVGAMPVHRVLPRRALRTVGAWCFADQMGPATVSEQRGVDIGPHPHIGLQTVTWLVQGEILHRDSLGSEQVVRPGQLNLMTAGRGVAHSEEATGRYRGDLLGAQLWVAQPEATRHGDPEFAHHPDLPRVELPGAEITVVVGELAGATSPARADSPLVGAELVLAGSAAALPLRPEFEHALVVLAGAVAVDGVPVRPGELGFLGRGRDELALTAAGTARVLLLGGEPLDEPLLVWWNYVARSRAEVESAAADWNDEIAGTARRQRFGRVASALPVIPSPVPPWLPGAAG